MVGIDRDSSKVDTSQRIQRMNPGRQLRVSQPGRQPRVARGQSAAGLAPCGIVGEIWGDVGMLGCVDLGERWQMGDGRLCTLPTRDITATDGDDADAARAAPLSSRCQPITCSTSTRHSSAGFW
ncbi:hypothetical protein I7I53_10004 [Histoplasma capsulatum var. duboisii H88]|uniref:Uncharacterized protein n=1 Tax=Ajellomyces capsulatus (strain H88) TaxID=544711 RepID=A0A8A1LC49_AJEC8|nr:hypothetical protein I7I53_10004 [Histoplasma capsulatum var. duboisii H88]